VIGQSCLSFSENDWEFLNGKLCCDVEAYGGIWCIIIIVP
jgi:hypothetical protein